MPKAAVGCGAELDCSRHPLPPPACLSLTCTPSVASCKAGAAPQQLAWLAFRRGPARETWPANLLAILYGFICSRALGVPHRSPPATGSPAESDAFTTVMQSGVGTALMAQAPVHLLHYAWWEAGSRLLLRLLLAANCTATLMFVVSHASPAWNWTLLLLLWFPACLTSEWGSGGLERTLRHACTPSLVRLAIIQPLNKPVLAVSPLPSPCPAGAATIINPARPRIVNLWAKASAATSLTLSVLVLVLVRALHWALALPAPPLDAECLAYLLLGSSH